MTGNRILDLMLESFGTILLPGLTMTLPLTAISFALALVIAVITALVQFADIGGLKQLARFYVWVIRGTPLIVQLFVIFYGLPNVGILIDPFPAAILVFSINQGAYCSETIRAALESVPAGQMEAGQCVGMSYLQIIRRIILPQAMRTAFPPLSNSLIGLVKDTSLAANITVVEMFMATQRIVARTFESLALYIEVGLVYLLFCTVLTKLQRIGEKKLASYGGKRRGRYGKRQNAPGAGDPEVLRRSGGLKGRGSDGEPGRRDRCRGPQRLRKDHAASVHEFPGNGGRGNHDL